MTHVQSEEVEIENRSDSTPDELPHRKCRKRYRKRKECVAEKCSKKHVRKHQTRQRRSTRLANPAASCVDSEFVSSTRRLTRRVGLFTNGKTSTQVSRFEFIASEETRARAEQDLQKILNLSCNDGASDSKEIGKNCGASSRKCSCQKRYPDNMSDDYQSWKVSTPYQSTSKLCKFSDKKEVSEVLVQAKDTSAQNNLICDSVSNPRLSGVMARLYRTLNIKREELFPCVSHKHNLRNELIALQKHFKALRSECSSSGSISCNAGSENLSQSTFSSQHRQANIPMKSYEGGQTNQSPAVFKLDFNPELLLNPSPVKNLFSVFDVENEIFVKEPEEKLHQETHHIYQDDIFDNTYLLLSPLCEKRSHNTTSSCSSSESEGQSAWKPTCSPSKPPEESPLCSWNFPRRKMY